MHSSQVIRIIMLQKRAIRLIYGATYFSHTEPLASQFKVLLFSDVNKLKTALLMFEIFYTKCYSRFNVLSNIFVHRCLHMSIRNTSHNFPIS